MTIDEAIKFLQAMIKDRKGGSGSYSVAALRMGIEALKRIRDSRIAVWNPINAKLPGETK